MLHEKREREKGVGVRERESREGKEGMKEKLQNGLVVKPKDLGLISSPCGERRELQK